MARPARKILFDKDIRELEIKPKYYKRAVGNPKQLYIFVYPSGIKTFSLMIDDDYNFKKIHTFREGIYSVAEARKDANKLLKDKESGKNIKNKDTFARFFTKYIEQQRVKGLKPSYIDKITRAFEKYILPHFADYKINDIRHTDLLEVLNALFNPNNPQTSRLETIHRLIQHLNKIFALAIKDRAIDYNPAFGLRDGFPTTHKFYRNNDIDTRYPALINHSDIAELIQDLKRDNKMDLQTKRAIYLQILCVNRPINTVSIKWEYIDFDKGIWTIPANEMKMGYTHTVALNSYALQILKTQYLFSQKFNFVFPAFNQAGHLHRDTLSKAFRNLGGKDKWSGKATTHGWRATFRTICSQHKIELANIDIGEEVIESVLAHKTLNEVKFAYEREKATIEQKHKLMQWYGDYLNSIEPLGII